MTDQDPHLEEARLFSSQRFLLAGLFSAFIPGAGQFLIRRPIRALVFITIFGFMCFLYIWLRLPRSIYGLALPVFAVLILSLVSSLDAAFPGRAQPFRPGTAWIVAFLPTAFVGASIHSNWLMRAAGFGVFSNIARSMAPAIPEGSRIIVDRRCYQHAQPRRGEVVVFVPPTDPRLLLIKRVIAVGGDTIEVRRNSVVINDQVIEEPYVLDKDWGRGVANPINLPRGKLFLMGDARAISLDSREYGPIDVSMVRGKVIYELPWYGTSWKDSLKPLDADR